VRNDQRRSPAGSNIHAGLNGLLGFGVQRRSGFIKHQNRRVLEQCSGNRNALLLATRKLETPFAHLGVIAIRQRFYELMQVRRFGGGNHLVTRGRWVAVQNVVIQTVVKQHRILRHNRNATAQAVLINLADIDAVHQNAAARHIIKAIDQTGQRRLART